MAELDDLPESVRVAFDEIDDCMRMDIKVNPVGALNVLRAELLRLSSRVKELERAESLYAGMQNCVRAAGFESITEALAELAALKAKIAVLSPVEGAMDNLTVLEQMLKCHRDMAEDSKRLGREYEAFEHAKMARLIEDHIAQKKQPGDGRDPVQG